ncbi:uncharacterized protein LOC111051797 isoform X1 [Nilaparvata lugens]|uniref:uncharacterized protein LOC111051797 isoform X1 n=1 Tax=Nilaparvata lugens TaxID=108931 RepID=UPI00193DC74A|nr:uncharacterized protein LOC111051797 isoform X1 [Nilaparvata lugens]
MEQYFTTEEDILRELNRQLCDSDAGSADEVDFDDSDVGDIVLPNDDNVFDTFDGEDTDPPLPVDDNERNFEIGKDDDTIWTDRPLVSRFAKVPSRNLIYHLPGPSGAAVGETNAQKLFSLFITDNMIETIVTFTNCEIETLKMTYNTEERYMMNTDAIEIKGLFSLLSMSAVLKNSSLTTKDMFYPVFGPPLFRCGCQRIDSNFC